MSQHPVPTETTMLDWALAYASAGYPVFPVHTIRNGACSCGGIAGCKPGKHPVGRLAPRGLLDATIDAHVIIGRWHQMPDANIGVPTGRVSGLVGLDVDGVDGNAALAALEREHGRLPPTRSVETGKGQHLHFTYPKNVFKVKSVSNQNLKLDVRGDGGYLIMPPSIHANGRGYSFTESNIENLSELPLWVVAFANGTLQPKTAPNAPGDPTADNRKDRPKLTMGDSGTPSPSSVAEETRLRSALASIPAVEYDIWLHVGMALHWTNWGERAFRIWNDWSQTCPEKYNEIEQHKKWESFDRAKREGPQITVGTIIHMARDREWKDATAAADCTSGSKLAESRDPTQREKLVLIGLDADLWHDKDGNVLGTVKVNGHHENFAINSRAFRNWLTRAYGDRYPMKFGDQTCPSAPSTQSLTEAIGALAAKAATGAEHQGAVRVGEHGGLIYLDLGTPDWSAVEISTTGWRIIPRAPVRFIRPAGLRRLPIPVGGGQMRELRDFLNVGSEADFLLIVSWLIASLRPTGPYPVLVINGEQGAGKSIACRVLRNLIDPNAAELRTEPRDERDLMLAAKNSWIVALDNLSYVRNDLSDAICRIATKGAFATRALYTNDEEFFLEVCRPVLLNGIPPLAARPDLADRAIVCVLPTMDDGRRRTEEAFWTAFEEAGPRLFGALLDGVSGAMRIYPSVELKHSYRMMDFAKWSEAACRGLGYQPGTFEAGYEQNRSSASDDALDADSVAGAIIELMAGKQEFVGTAAELLSALEVFVLPTQRDRYWPKDATRLSTRLRRLAPLLRSRGIATDFGDRTPDAARRRLIKIKRASPK
jgi:hypothetical protein